MDVRPPCLPSKTQGILIQVTTILLIVGFVGYGTFRIWEHESSLPPPIPRERYTGHVICDVENDGPPHNCMSVKSYKDIHGYSAGIY